MTDEKLPPVISNHQLQIYRNKQKASRKPKTNKQTKRRGSCDKLPAIGPTGCMKNHTLGTEHSRAHAVQSHVSLPRLRLSNSNYRPAHLTSLPDFVTRFKVAESSSLPHVTTTDLKKGNDTNQNTSLRQVAIYHDSMDYPTFSKLSSSLRSSSDKEVFKAFPWSPNSKVDVLPKIAHQPTKIYTGTSCVCTKRHLTHKNRQISKDNSTESVDPLKPNIKYKQQTMLQNVLMTCHHRNLINGPDKDTETHKTKQGLLQQNKKTSKDRRQSSYLHLCTSVAKYEDSCSKSSPSLHSSCSLDDQELSLRTMRALFSQSLKSNGTAKHKAGRRGNRAATRITKRPLKSMEHTDGVVKEEDISAYLTPSVTKLSLSSSSDCGIRSPRRVIQEYASTPRSYKNAPCDDTLSATFFGQRDHNTTSLKKGDRKLMTCHGKAFSQNCQYHDGDSKRLRSCPSPCSSTERSEQLALRRQANVWRGFTGEEIPVLDCLIVERMKCDNNTTCRTMSDKDVPNFSRHRLRCEEKRPGL